jgi:hypothetical protein
MNRLREQLPTVGESLQEFPQVVHGLIQKASEGQLEIRVSTPGIDELRRENLAISRRRNRAVAGTGILLTAAVLLGLDAGPSWLAWTTGAAAIWLLASSLR